MVAKFTPCFRPRTALAARGALRRAATFLAVVVVATLMLGGARPASASGSPTLEVTPAQGLDPAGAFVVVSGQGFDPNSKLFVMQCRNNSGEDHTCNSVGLQKVDTDADGSFPDTRVKVIGNFGSTDCSVTPCAVKTSSVSGHADNRSQDVLTPLTFDVAPGETAPADSDEVAPTTVPSEVRELAGGRDVAASSKGGQSDATTWLFAGAAVALVGGAGAIFALRSRRES